MVEVGRSVWESALPAPCSEQGHLERVAQDLALSGFEYLCGWSLHDSGQPAPVVSHLDNEMFSVRFKRGFLYFSVCPLPLVTEP